MFKEVWLTYELCADRILESAIISCDSQLESPALRITASEGLRDDQIQENHKGEGRIVTASKADRERIAALHDDGVHHNSYTASRSCAT